MLSVTRGPGQVVIYDGKGSQERPDFQIVSSNLGRVDVEVTQLRSETTASIASAVARLEACLREVIANDAVLAAQLETYRVDVQPAPVPRNQGAMGEAIGAFVNHLRGRIGLRHDAARRWPGFVHLHEVSGERAAHRGVHVSQPTPAYGTKTDIDVVRQVNQKRLDARRYRRATAPLWLVAGVTADFGQLEISVGGVVQQIVKVRPFDEIIVIDNANSCPFPRTPSMRNTTFSAAHGTRLATR